MTNFISGFALVTKSGRLFRQYPGSGRPTGDASIFTTRANAEATNASALKGTGSVIELASGPMDGKRQIEGYWVK